MSYFEGTAGESAGLTQLQYRIILYLLCFSCYQAPCWKTYPTQCAPIATAGTSSSIMLDFLIRNYFLGMTGLGVLRTPISSELQD